MVSKEDYKRRLHIMAGLIAAARECVEGDEIITRDLLVEHTCEFGHRAEIAPAEVESVLIKDIQTLLIESVT